MKQWCPIWQEQDFNLIVAAARASEQVSTIDIFSLNWYTDEIFAIKF